MRVNEREAPFLIENGYLEKVEDLEYNGRRVQASRLGYLLASEWYKDRLRAKQALDIKLWTRHTQAVEATSQADLKSRLGVAREQLARVKSDAYLAELVGTIGADPSVS
jgi:hypothetical protein